MFETELVLQLEPWCYKTHVRIDFQFLFSVTAFCPRGVNSVPYLVLASIHLPVSRQ